MPDEQDYNEDFVGPPSPAQLEEQARKRRAPKTAGSGDIEAPEPPIAEPGYDYVYGPLEGRQIPVPRKPPGTQTLEEAQNRAFYARARNEGIKNRQEYEEATGETQTPGVLDTFVDKLAGIKPDATRTAIDPKELAGVGEEPPPTTTTTTTTTTPAPATPKPTSPLGGGGGGTSAAALFGPIGADFNEQIAATGREKTARSNLSDVENEQAGQVADLKRQYAQESAAQATATAAAGRAQLEEIAKLTHAYADGTVDEDKYWHDKSVPQKIATIVGAGLLGFGGHPEAALHQVNAAIDRSIALQQATLERKRTAAGHLENLYGLFMSTSKNEQEAYDKTRATLLDAAMVDATRAASAAKNQVQQAQMDQFIAALKAQRDELFMRLQAKSGGGGGAGPGGGWLEVDPKSLVTGSNGQQYLINNPQLSDDVTNALGAFKRIDSALTQGAALMESRDLTHPVDFYNSLKEGEVVDAAIAEAEAKLAGSRGLPPSIMGTIKQMKPSFGSALSDLDKAKIPALRHLLQQWHDDILQVNNARPMDVATGPGLGKHVGELKTYAKPSAGQSNAAPAAPRLDPTARFQPGP